MSEEKRTGSKAPPSLPTELADPAARCSGSHCRSSLPPSYHVQYIICPACRRVYHRDCADVRGACRSCGNKTLEAVQEKKTISVAEKVSKGRRIEYVPAKEGSLAGGTPVWIDCHGSHSEQTTFVPANMTVTIYGQIGEAMTFGRGVNLLHSEGLGATSKTYRHPERIPNFGVSELSGLEHRIVARVAAGKRVLWVGRDFEAQELCDGGPDCGRSATYLDDEYGSDDSQTVPDHHQSSCAGLFKVVAGLFADGEHIDLHLLMCLGSGADTTDMQEERDDLYKLVSELHSDSRRAEGDGAEAELVEPWTPRTEWRRRKDQFADLIQAEPVQAMWAWWRLSALHQAHASENDLFRQWYEEYEDTLNKYQPMFDTEEARIGILRAAADHLHSASNEFEFVRAKRKKGCISLRRFKRHTTLITGAKALGKKCEICANSYSEWRDQVIAGNDQFPELTEAQKEAGNLWQAGLLFIQRYPEEPFGPWIRDIARAVRAELNQLISATEWVELDSPGLKGWG